MAPVHQLFHSIIISAHELDLNDHLKLRLLI